MNENSFEWFQKQVNETIEHIRDEWPAWMKNTSNLATASFPAVEGPPLKSDSSPAPETGKTKRQGS